MLPGQCFYVPIVDETGGMLNDPVALKLSEDRWWISIADSDLLFWVKGLAYGYRLDVLVDEPDVSPLAVQGPKAEELVARIFGDAVRAIKFFRFGWFDFQGVSLAVARSGYLCRWHGEWHAALERAFRGGQGSGCPCRLSQPD
jgi:dimethylsulfoniopropionate demethylase